jgi:catechol 2,3-dioxygenase-like lactoylglutathione lyase family enzyme
MMKDLAHIAIASRNNDAAIAFYTETLGFTLKFRRVLAAPHLDYAMVQLGTCTIELLQPLAGPEGGMAPVLHHFALAVEDIDGVVESMRGRGVVFEQDEPMEFPDLFARGAKGIFLRGPNGEAIELFETL